MLIENHGLPGWSQLSRQSDKNFGLQGQTPISTTLQLEAWPLSQPQSEGQVQDSATTVSKFVLLNRKRIVIWHDVINNSITPHRSNNNRPLSPEQLIETLKKLKSNGQIEAIVYTRRAGTPDLSIDLRQTGILILEATKNLSSRRKQANFEYLYQLTKVHPETHIDLKLVTTVLLNCQNFRKLIKKKRSKKPAKKKPNKRQKDRKKLDFLFFLLFSFLFSA